MKPILTDICWTLYSSNTTFDFMDATIRDEGYRRLRRWSKNPIVRRLNILLLRLTRHDLIRERALRYLERQYSSKEIEQMAEHFVHEELATRKIKPAWDTIKGREVVLVSGTIPPIARAVAKEIGATKVYAGDIFKQQVQNAYAQYDILTDNLSDIELVRRAEQATIITYGNRKRWQQLLQNKQVTYIDRTAARY